MSLKSKIILWITTAVAVRKATSESAALREENENLRADRERANNRALELGTELAQVRAELAEVKQKAAPKPRASRAKKPPAK